MSNKDEQNNNPEEMDLGVLFQKINNFFSNISFSIFKGILFIKKNSLIIIGLLIIGASLGYFLDNGKASYTSEIIVYPSNGSTDYLYSKIDLFASKLGEDDTAFFKSIGMKNYKNIGQVKIEPIIDIYNLVNNSTSAASAQNTQNFELVKLLAESSDINIVIKDKLTSKNYPYHSIQIATQGQISRDNVIQPLLKWLNKDEYLSKISAISKTNVLDKMKKNEQEIKQLDTLIGQISKSVGSNERSSNLVYNNENNQLNGLFELKNNLINEIAVKKIELIKMDLFIKDISIVTNVKNTKGLNGKMKFILPFLFIFLFTFIRFFKSFYKKQSEKLTKL